ncbi:MAG TPA: radical SAM protein, partial [Bacillota bacterium]|nr:radical SAM protein [Bacillota bacterium]
MNLVYADKDGNVYDHPEYLGIARSGDQLLEILEDELIPLPDGATLVSLPESEPIGLDPNTGEMVLFQDANPVGALLPQGFTRLLVPAYHKNDKNYKFPLFGYTAVVWKDNQFYVAAKQTDEHDKWNPA